MKRSILNRIAILLYLLICIGCKVKKDVITQPSSPALSNVTVSKSEILDNIIAKQANFNTLSIRAKADLDIDNKSNNVNMTIRIQKDKAIWVSLTVIANVEVARALITPDSIKIRNNLESTYIKKPFSYLYQFTNKQLNFNMLQEIFAGNVMPEFVNERSSVNLSGKAPLLSGILNDLIYAVAFNEEFRVIRTNLKNGTGQTLAIDYGDFILISQQIIPQSVNIKSSASNRNINMVIKYNRVDINVPVDVPFSVPQRFTVKD